MENLNSNSNSAFHGLDRNGSTGGGHFPTLPLSGSTFSPRCHSSASGHLMVPGDHAHPTTQAAQSAPKVVPTITRSQSSSNLPEALPENPYDEVGGGFRSRFSTKMKKKACSQWDMASQRNNRLQVGCSNNE